jgi:hypothetical protein
LSQTALRGGRSKEEEPLQLGLRRRAYESALGRLALTAEFRDDDPAR